MAEATQATNLTLSSTRIANTYKMINPGVDRDKPNSKKQNKSLIPGVPAQLAKNVPK